MDSLLANLAKTFRGAGLEPWVPDPPYPVETTFGNLVANGPRAHIDPQAYALLVETVYEGYLLHNGEPRIVKPDSSDLALLIGDRLYALGLRKVVEQGDLKALGELADIIALSAQAHAVQDIAFAEAVWRGGTVAIGWGQDSRYCEAKQQAFTGNPIPLQLLVENTTESV